jgi:ABC-type glutathione transport system ATPase component
MTSYARASAPGTAAGTRAAAIEVNSLVKTYPKGPRALDGLTFAVPAGSVFALLGPNGAGKSTTIKILTTLARADSGTAFVAGLDVRAHPARARRTIGVVAQRSGADPMAGPGAVLPRPAGLSHRRLSPSACPGAAACPGTPGQACGAGQAARSRMRSMRRTRPA